MINPLLFAAVLAPVPPELGDYLAKPDPSYRYEIASNTGSREVLNLTSQRWQGNTWKHTVILEQPKSTVAKGTAILFITGDGPRPGDYTDLSLMSFATGMPIAMLFDIPNQPTYGMKEDDLIAHTFERYIATGDAKWPLLFPMTKSALRAMDAVVDATKSTDNPITKFVVTGASKRGWTTWMVGASQDSRVIGIAPMVYDNLNIVPQMKHQLQQWGAYSEQIQDYTRRGLQAKLETPAGKRLATIVDPYSYRANIKVPTLIVRGANDPYWTVDAARFYWNDLKQPHWMVSVPNAGHGLGDKLRAVETVGAFARSLAGEFSMPTPKMSLRIAGRDIRYSVASPGATPSAVKIWVAQSSTTDFRPSTYVALSPTNLAGVAKLGDITTVPVGQHIAAFIEVRYRINGREFGICSPTQVR